MNRSGKLKLWVHVLLTVAILAGLAIAASKYLHGDEMAAAMRAFEWKYAAPILLGSAVYLALKALWFGIAVNDLAPKVSIGRIMVAYISGQPATLLPGGIAARAALLAEAGVPGSVSSVPILLSSLLDTLCFTLLALISALWFPQARRPALVLIAILIAVFSALAIPPLRRVLNALLGRLMRRFKWGAQWENFTRSLGRAATLKIFGGGIAITLTAKFLLTVVLGWCLAAIGLHVAFPALLLANSLPTILGRATPSPAGAGPTEAAMVALLNNAAGIGLSVAAVAVALFRVTTVLYHALLGEVVYFALWRTYKVRTPEGKAVVAPKRLA
jgi:uncharacterized membrane protein YbhN (UPF0104 family)